MLDRLRDYHAESKPGSCFLFKSEVETSGWLSALLRKARTDFTSASQMCWSLVFSLPKLQLRAVPPHRRCLGWDRPPAEAPSTPGWLQQEGELQRNGWVGVLMDGCTRR